MNTFKKLASDYFGTGIVLADLFNHFGTNQEDSINPYRLSSLDPAELIIYDDQTSAVGPADFQNEISSVLVSDGKEAYLVISTDRADELRHLASLHVLGYGYTDYMSARRRNNPYSPASSDAPAELLPVSSMLVYLGEELPTTEIACENVPDGAGNVVGGHEERQLVLPASIDEEQIHTFSSSLRELFEGLRFASDPQHANPSRFDNSDFRFLSDSAAALLGYCTGISF